MKTIRKDEAEDVKSTADEISKNGENGEVIDGLNNRYADGANHNASNIDNLTVCDSAEKTASNEDQVE